MSKINIEDVKSSLSNKKKPKEILNNIIAKQVKQKDPKVYGPNGRKYLENDISFLVKNGYTREAAIDTLSKNEKYTDPSVKDAIKQAIGTELEKSVLRTSYVQKASEQLEKAAKSLHKKDPLTYGPNGKTYSKNDMQYLMDKGYSKEQAAELLSKNEKYTKELDYQHLKDYSVKNLARQVVQDQLDVAMLKSLEKCKTKYGILGNIILNEDCILEMKAIIRGHKTAEIKNPKLMQEIRNEAETKLQDLVNNQITKILGLADKGEYALNKSLEPIDKIYDKINKFVVNGSNKITTIIKDEKSLENYITSTLESLEYKQLRLESTINKINTIAGTIGLDININDSLKPVVENINKKITTKLTTKLMPQITKHIKEFEKVQKKIEEARKRVNAYRDNFVKEQKQRLTNYVNKEASKAISSLKGSLKKLF